MNKKFYYPSFELPTHFVHSKDTNVLKMVFDQKFDELDDGGDCDLDSAISQVLRMIYDNHGRVPLIYMALLLSRSVQNNIKWYRKDDIRTGLVISNLKECIDSKSTGVLDVPVYPELGATGSQALDEAMFVINVAAQSLVGIPDRIIGFISRCMYHRIRYRTYT